MTANLYEKNGKYHVMLSWVQGDKRKQKSVATHISVQGNNKRKAEAVKREILDEWETRITDDFTDILFSEYLLDWLEIVRCSIAETTYISYKSQIEHQICPYFSKHKILLRDLKPHHIQTYYKWKMDKDSVTANTIHHYHANIHKALKHAYRTELISGNPADKVVLPKVEMFQGNCYTQDELKQLITAVTGTRLEVPVMLAAWFGMRRGEVIGLRWNSVNFESGTLTVEGVVTNKGVGNPSEKEVYRKGAKTKTSLRTFPMSPEVSAYLQEVRQRQADNRSLCGNAYNLEWLDFVCVDEMGNRIHLDYISNMFPKILKRLGLRVIRFHDLRHTNISLLLEHGASLKEAQDWAGHSSVATTGDIYAHVQMSAKRRLAETMRGILA